MFHFCSFVLLDLLLRVIKAFHVEIDLIEENPSTNSPKFICKPSSEKLNLTGKRKVLWNGTQFGENELKELSEKLQADLLMPRMSINSSTKHVCYLTVPGSFTKSLSSLKKRVLRDDAEASIPMENGICPPGHRIDQDRCFPCFPGSYTSGQETECFLCPKDFYMTDKAADSCWPCPEGKKTLAQGADSEESCINLNETGHAEIKQNSPWMILYVVIGCMILIVWTAIIILLIQYWNQLKEKEVDEEKMRQDREDSLSKKRLLSDDHVYETISGSKEGISARIDGDDDAYEVPRKPSDPALYLDLEAPPLPPRRKDTEQRSDSIYKSPSEKSSEDQYEIPIKKSSTVEPKRSSEEQYEVPIKVHSSDQYEVPIRRSSDHAYIDILDDPEDHIYSEIKSEDEINEVEAGNDTKIRSSSRSFEPVSFPTDSARQIASRSDEGRKYSFQSRRSSEEMGM